MKTRGSVLLLIGVAMAFLISVTPGASANTIIDSHVITGSGPGSVGHTFFTVTVGGTFDLFTHGPTIDPVIFLFVDDGSPVGALTGALIASDDDSCPFSQCGPAGSFSNSLINDLIMAPGNYVLAVSDFGFGELQARADFNFNDLTGTVGIEIASLDGTAVGGSQQPVPEPATLTLLGVGLLGLAGVAWRRKR